MQNPTNAVQEQIAAAERKRRASILYLFSIVLIFIQTSYAIYDYRSGLFVVDSYLEFAASAILLVNLLAYFRTRDIEIALSALTSTVMTLILFVVPNGGIEHTSFLWLTVFPATSFLFGGYRRGLLFNLLFVFCLGVMIVAQYYGYLTTAYTITQFGQLLAVLGSLMLLATTGELAQVGFRKTIVAQQEQLHTLLENLPVGVIMVDAKTKKMMVTNASLERLLGRPIDIDNVDIKNFSTTYRLTDAKGTPYPPDQAPILIALSKGVPAMVRNIFVGRPDGQTAVLRISAAPIRDQDGVIQSGVAVWEDMTKEFEIDQMKSEFISLASHQLKTPLTAIKWSSEALLDGSAGPLTPAQTGFIQQIQLITDRLSRLVSDLLNVSHIDTGKNFTVVRVSTDVTPVVQGVVQDLAELALRHQVRVTVDLPTPCILDIDQGKMHEVFVNLLSNAIKYSKPGGHVEVGSTTHNGLNVLFVKDNGIGIPKKEQTKVFERFYRASNVPVDAEGTGLGLPIAKAIIDHHDGQLWLESEDGVGTTFYISIPPLKPTATA